MAKVKKKSNKYFLLINYFKKTIVGTFGYKPIEMTN